MYICIYIYICIYMYIYIYVYMYASKTAMRMMTSCSNPRGWQSVKPTLSAQLA